jgi:hypothetical protein
MDFRKYFWWRDRELYYFGRCYMFCGMQGVGTNATNCPIIFSRNLFYIPSHQAQMGE